MNKRGNDGTDENYRCGKSTRRTLSPPRDDQDLGDYATSILNRMLYISEYVKDAMEKAESNADACNSDVAAVGGSKDVASSSRRIIKIVRCGKEPRRKKDNISWCQRGEGGTDFYVVGTKDSSGFLQRFNDLVGKLSANPQKVEVARGRTFNVTLGANGCAYFSFADLCDTHFEAEDYSALLKRFHTIAVEGVPIFGIGNKIAAYDFITLVDAIYDNNARLLCLADGAPADLFKNIVTTAEANEMSPNTSDLCVDDEIGVLKNRTIRRLTEINNSEYLESHASVLAQKKRED